MARQRARSASASAAERIGWKDGMLRRSTCGPFIGSTLKAPRSASMTKRSTISASASAARVTGSASSPSSASCRSKVSSCPRHASRASGDSSSIRSSKRRSPIAVAKVGWCSRASFQKSSASWSRVVGSAAAVTRSSYRCAEWRAARSFPQRGIWVVCGTGPSASSLSSSGASPSGFMASPASPRLASLVGDRVGELFALHLLDAVLGAFCSPSVHLLCVNRCKSRAGSPILRRCNRRLAPRGRACARRPAGSESAHAHLREPRSEMEERKCSSFATAAGTS